MTYEDIVCNKEILEYYKRGSAILDELGYTENWWRSERRNCWKPSNMGRI